MRGPDEDLSPVERLALVAAAALSAAMALSILGMVIWAFVAMLRWFAAGEAGA